MPDGLVQPTDRQGIDAFVEAYRKSPYVLGEDGQPLPIVPSPIDREGIREHETLMGTPLPALFRAYLSSWSLPNTDLYVGQLPPIPPDRPFEYVERWSFGKMDQPFYRRNERLVPFTHGPADCSDLCFDIDRRSRSGDYPIIKVWHGRLDEGDGVWSDLECERAQVFDDFSAYLDFLHEWLIYKTAAPGPRFEDWLRAGNKKVPPSYYGEPW